MEWISRSHCCCWLTGLPLIYSACIEYVKWDLHFGCHCTCIPLTVQLQLLSNNSIVEPEVARCLCCCCCSRIAKNLNNEFCIPSSALPVPCCCSSCYTPAAESPPDWLTWLCECSWPAPVMSNKRINLFYGGSRCWTFSWKMLVISGRHSVRSLRRCHRAPFCGATFLFCSSSLHCEFIESRRAVGELQISFPFDFWFGI